MKTRDVLCMHGYRSLHPKSQPRQMEQTPFGSRQDLLLDDSALDRCDQRVARVAFRFDRRRQSFTHGLLAPSAMRNLLFFDRP